MVGTSLSLAIDQTLESEVGKVTLKINSDEALNDDFS